MGACISSSRSVAITPAAGFVTTHAIFIGALLQLLVTL
jgi:ammonia channel protein AmtB